MRKNSFLLKRLLIENFGLLFSNFLTWLVAFKLKKGNKSTKNKNLFFGSKKHGISGIARCRNSAEFLKKTIMTHIDICDEIVLINNGSSDETEKISLELQAEFPQKIRYMNYPFKVQKAYNQEADQHGEIHSLADYYNWCFSQSRYDITYKIDDDDFLFITQSQKMQLRQSVLSMSSDSYFMFSGINLCRVNESLQLFKRPIQFAGFMGDHGFFYFGTNAYFVDGKFCEVIYFSNKCLVNWLGFIYLHLKYLKKNYAKGEIGFGEFAGSVIKKDLNLRKFPVLNAEITDSKKLLEIANSLLN